MIKKIAMVATMIVLTFLIMITPTFISKQTPIGAAPRVLIDNLRYSIFVDVASVVEDYRYWNISLKITGLDNLSYKRNALEEQTYDLHLTVTKNDTRIFALNVTLFDKNRMGYDYNATVEALNEPSGNAMLVRRAGTSDVSTVTLGNVFRDTLIARSS